MTGEIVAATHDEWRMIEDEDLDVDDLPKWQQPLIERMRAVEQSNDFVALPSKFLIHEWQIMHDFCLSVPPDRLRNELYDGIHGSGAFRIFKAMIRRHRLEDAWRDFRQQKLEAIAIDFLDKHGILWMR